LEFFFFSQIVSRNFFIFEKIFFEKNLFDFCYGRTQNLKSGLTWSQAGLSGLETKAQQPWYELTKEFLKISELKKSLKIKRPTV